MIVIETPRFYLRHYTLDDLDALAEVLCDHDNMRFFPNRFERKDAEERIQKNLRRYEEDRVGQWPLFLKPGHKFGGYCGLVRLEVDGAKEIEVGCACMNYAFTTLGEERIISSSAPRISPHAASQNATAWPSKKKPTSWDFLTWSIQLSTTRLVDSATTQAVPAYIFILSSIFRHLPVAFSGIGFKASLHFALRPIIS